jgi:aspartate carbamoyltransferase regulatory subunit
MKDKRTELKVSAIRSGTVIDHIPSNTVFQVFKILGLQNSTNQVYFGTNLDSQKYGKKGIIKISGKCFEEKEISKIAIVAPTATIIEIEDYVVTKKENVQLPEHITNIVKCFNPKCVTNHQRVPTAFDVIEDHNGKMKLLCNYCEKTMGQENIEFI